MNIHKDVRDLIRLNERIQSALARGEVFSADESVIIRMCASELLEKVSASTSDVTSLDGHSQNRRDGTHHS